MLTLLAMTRGQYDTVTELPVLIPCAPDEQDGLATFLMEFRAPKPVRAVTSDDFKPTSKKHQEARSAMRDYEREQFMAVLALCKTLQTEDKLAIASARQHATRALSLKREGDQKLGVMPAQENDLAFGQMLIPLFGLSAGQEKEAIARWSGYRLGPKAEADEKWLFSQLMSEGLDTVRLVLWWSDKRFRPALYCPDAKAALHAFLLMKVAAGHGWGVCLKCGEFFVQKRPDQNYCSIAHREAHRVARWRAAKLAKARGKRRRNGTRKTR
jgi:hypothetical protein